jgi:DNA segregation ATPase FtsK/SpoIIIE, S-DNA-T family
MNSVAQFNQILSDFKIKANCLDAQQIDNYIYYDLKLHPNTKVRQIQRYSDEISLALHTPCKPSVKIMHELGLVRLEFISPSDTPLKLLDFLSKDDVPEGGLISCLGQTVDGKKVWMDLAQNPHMIVAGTTGSGKSTLLHNIIGNMLYYSKPIIYLMDPKNIEFHGYDRMINKDINVSYTYDESIFVLDSLLATMEERYRLIRGGQLASNFPYVLLMIDEFADLIMQDVGDQFFTKLCRLAQKCRAARISIIIATQRPSVNVISGIIKANFPARIACKVASHVDSKVILDVSGAENLLGRGDAMLRDNFRHLERFQVAYTDANELFNYFGE